ncbi:MAG: hypothetical protein ACAI25_08635 [Planctomycetota bacterium]
MSGFVPRGRAESALRFLPQKISTFERLHTANHMLVVLDFVDHMERDDVLTHLVAALRRRMPVSGRAWADATGKLGSPSPLPEDPVAAIALRFDVLKQVRLEKIDLRHFTANYYPGEHLNERLMHWKRAIVHPLAEDLRRLAKVLLDKLPDGDRFDMEELSGEVLDAFGPSAFGPRAWTDADDEVGDKKAKLDAALDALVRIVKGAEQLSADERHDLALEAKIVASSVRRGRTAAVGAQLDALAAKPGLADAVDAVKKLL